jgi:mycothiol synthase
MGHLAPPLVIAEIDREHPDPRHLGALAALGRSVRAETRPHDVAPTEEHIRRALAGVAAQGNFDVRVAVAWRDGVAAGDVTTASSRKGDNAHVLQVEAYVMPLERRRGVGTRLLEVALGRARTEGRTLIIGTTNERVAAGEPFARRVGARPGLVSLVYEATLAELDTALLAAWLRAGPERAPDVELAWLGSPYPDDQLASLATVMLAMNDIPLGDLQLSDRTVTPATLRDQDGMRRARGDERWTLVARRREDGAIVGATETLWNAANPAVLMQLDTVVLREARGRGLGRWLKAAMLERVLRERPEARVVRTDNASLNAPMQAINDALGFRVALTETVWQVEVDVAAAALGLSARRGRSRRRPTSAA